MENHHNFSEQDLNGYKKHGKKTGQFIHDKALGCDL